jgi:hypothetical protein
MYCMAQKQVRAGGTTAANENQQAPEGSVAVYLFAAAVNFDAAILDGNDLSVIRGSSLTVLDFANALREHLQKAFAHRAHVEPLYSGASETVIRFRSRQAAAPPRVKIEAPFGSNQQWKEKILPALCTQVDAGASIEDVALAWINENKPTIKRKQLESFKSSIVRQIEYRRAEKAAAAAVAAEPGIDESVINEEVEAFLKAKAKLKYFTFAHACYTPQKQDNLAGILAVLFSRQRTWQLQTPTVALPDAVTSLLPAEKAFCLFTLGRQASLPGAVEKGKPISASARIRRSEGRQQKQAFYGNQIKRSADAAEQLGDSAAASKLREALEQLEQEAFSIAEDFNDIVIGGPGDLPPNVKGKLAVVFMDGNGFTAKRTSCANWGTIDQAFSAYRTFCLALERNGGLILAGVLPWMLKRQEFCGGSGGNRYLRFETLLWGGDDICFVLPAWGAFAFMEKLQDILKGLRAPVRDREEVLTYKAGMVFADHKSPIRDLRTVAEQLAYAAKETSGDCNIVQVMALEGLDRADLDPARLRGELFGEGLRNDPGAFGLEGANWRRIREAIAEIGRTAGRSQLHKWYADAEERKETEDAGDRENNKPLLQLPGKCGNVKAFINAFEERLEELDVPEPLRAVLTGKDCLLASRADRWPLLPLHHVLMLADYIEAIPLAPAAGRGAT